MKGRRVIVYAGMGVGEGSIPEEGQDV